MKKIVFTLCLSLAIPVMAAGPNGQIDSPGGDPAIAVNADWYATTAAPPAFFWSGSGTVFSSDGPFTFSCVAEVRVDVTDDFFKGDQFRIYDSGVFIGNTSWVETCPGNEVGPEAAFKDPTYSSGSFTLGPGDHSITIEVTTIPFSGGRGYIRVTIRPHRPSYWKSNPDAWPTDEIEIGGETYSQEEALTLMQMPVKGDKTLTMFPALVAAKLNILNDAFPVPCIADTIAEADAWMAANPPGSGVRANSAAWKNHGGALNGILDEYNSDLLTCPD